MNAVFFEVGRLPAHNPSDVFPLEAGHPGEHKLIWLTEGEGMMSVNGKNQSLFPRAIYWIFQGDIDHVNLKNSSAGYFVRIQKSFFDEPPFNASFSAPVQAENGIAGLRKFMTTDPAGAAAGQFIQRLQYEFNHTHVHRTDMMLALIRLLLIDFTRQCREPFLAVKETRDLRIVREFYGIVEKNFMRKMYISDYAGLLNLTPNYLNVIVKKVSGISANQYIRQRVIQEAKAKCCTEDLSMKELCYFLGFHSASHFSKFFKKVSGTGYTAFKRSLHTNAQHRIQYD